MYFLNKIISHQMLRPFIVKVSVLSVDFPLPISGFHDTRDYDICFL